MIANGGLIGGLILCASKSTRTSGHLLAGERQERLLEAKAVHHAGHAQTTIRSQTNSSPFWK
jgi:hypothetical protein